MDEVKIQLKVRYVTLIICILLTLIIVWMFILFSSPSPSMDTVFRLIATCIALSALIYTAMNVQLISQQHQNSILIQKRAHATDIISQWHSPEMTNLTVIGSALRKEVKDLQPKEVVDYLKSHPHKQVAMASILNYFEKMALAIEHDLADEAILKDFFKTIVRVYYHALSGFISEKRKDFESTDIFEKFEALAERWS